MPQKTGLPFLGFYRPPSGLQESTATNDSHRGDCAAAILADSKDGVRQAGSLQHNEVLRSAVCGMRRAACGLRHAVCGLRADDSRGQ
jgi:hypothetical protein